MVLNPGKMNCKEIEELLMQYAFDELSEEESESIRIHLEQCEHCSAELKMDHALYRLTQKLKDPVPFDANKAGSITHIITALDPVKQEPVHRLMPNRIVRWIINAAAIFLVGLFLIQQVEMKQNLKSLETKMNQPATSKPPQAMEYALPELTSLPEDKIILLIEEYEKLVSENQAILDYLQENHPETYQKIKELSIKNISSVNEL